MKKIICILFCLIIFPATCLGSFADWDCEIFVNTNLSLKKHPGWPTYYYWFVDDFSLNVDPKFPYNLPVSYYFIGISSYANWEKHAGYPCYDHRGSPNGGFPYIAWHDAEGWHFTYLYSTSGWFTIQAKEKWEQTKPEKHIFYQNLNATNAPWLFGGGPCPDFALMTSSPESNGANPDIGDKKCNRLTLE